MSRKRENEETIKGDSGRVKTSKNYRSMLGSHSPHNSVMPCAACKLLRRRCSQECPFLPYFPPNEPHKFACVHKIFGASNVSKMLLEVPENQRVDVANSLVYEANARIRDPVYGCMGVISALQQQAQSLQAELNAVRAEIIRYRRHENVVAAATVGATLATGFTNGAPERICIATQTSAPPHYAPTPSTSSASPDIKERYWTSMN
ncbi:hypothetical protein O6H91_11G094300 [Diphasiastrum complanatum]|uniref:Uncharacterized protein n=1 Tax=Diphasiastrum complanatum TaxID=34168 RepID=A0ACC2CBT6_DIPCM|nr:hypothetical protein O6H91_11G094300 [Diphasiastrum complanatum]